MIPVNGWPDSERPGCPHAETVAGWHWLRYRDDLQPALWTPSVDLRWQRGTFKTAFYAGGRYYLNGEPEDVAGMGVEYLGPVLLPQQTTDLGAMMRRCIGRLLHRKPEDQVALDAWHMLQRMGLQGSPFRDRPQGGG